VSKNRKQAAKPESFPLVGIGASAGGLEAFSQLLAELPTDTGMAFILIQHLDPTHESLSSEILSKVTKMRLQEAKDRMTIEPNHVYVIPPNYDMAVMRGELILLPRREMRAPHMSIDFFFRSLAQEKKGQAIGVILSGAASDGTDGLRAIKSAGGTTFAQDPKTARYDSMPSHAIAAGVIDIVLPPQAIARELAVLAGHEYLATAQGEGAHEAAERHDTSPPQAQVVQRNDPLRDIFLLLRSHTGVDFSDYKRTTILRRIQRRMMVQKSETLEAYAAFLGEHPDEIKTLYSDILISVTEFFRDPDSFQALQEEVFPVLVKKKNAGAVIRVWVPGCASGEEAYSILISLLEFLGDTVGHAPVQVFASDISESALQKARAGVYPETIAQNLSHERLNRFFTRVDGGYKINKAIRDMCLFSRHDVTSDPPFARIDLISCRNLLIYFAPVLQKRLIPIFHYALSPGGFLWLGNSETPSGASQLFETIDKTNKIYSKTNIPTPIALRFTASTFIADTVQQQTPKLAAMSDAGDLHKAADRILLSRFAPPGVLVDSRLEILQFRGRTVPYLEPAQGSPSNSLMKMARAELQPALRIAMDSALKGTSPIKKAGLSFEDQGKRKTVQIEVIPVNPLAPDRERKFLILFEEATSVPAPSRPVSDSAVDRTDDYRNETIARLEQEISSQREYQTALNDQFETTQEELTATNEELRSANEELQSTNEELQTAKEETQSTNEELNTVNDELRSRNADLTTISNDLNNFLASAEIPMVMVDASHRIRRFTPKAQELFRVISSDLGRPIGDIRPNFDLNLEALVSWVSASVESKEVEVQDRNGHWIRVHVRPYKTMDNRIDGAVITVVDIAALKEQVQETMASFEYVRSILDTVRLPLAVLDASLRLKSVNRAFVEHFHHTTAAIGSDFFGSLGIQSERVSQLRVLLHKAAGQDSELNDFEIECQTPGMGLRWILLSGRKIQPLGDDTKSPILLLALNEITERKLLEKERASLLIREQEARAEAERGNHAKDIFLATLSHELRTPLTSILSWVQLLRMGKLDPAKSKRGVEIIEQSAKAQGRLIDDLLDVSRALMGKLALEMKEIDPRTIVEAAIESVRPLADLKSVRIEPRFESISATISADPGRLQQIIWNLLTNAIKFSSNGGSIEIVLERYTEVTRQFMRIRVTDHGKGIHPEFLPVIFDRFSQADSASTRVHGGLGLGLAIVRSMTEMQNGSVQAESRGEGQGSTFTVNFPLNTDADQAKTPGTKEHPMTVLASKTPTAELTRLDGVRVLLVEDDEQSREAIAVVLKSFGAEVLSVESARDALTKLEEFKPSLLVSDIAMPVEDGYSLIRRIRALGPEQFGSIPAMALTAYAGEEDEKRVRAAGFQTHLSKPVEVDVLIRAIARLIPRPT